MHMRTHPIDRAARRATRRAPIRWRGQLAAYLFLLPALLLFSVFAWYPILSNFIYSFQHVEVAGTTHWIGLENYQRMLADPLLGTAWKNSIEFAALSIVIGFFLPVALAIGVNEVRVARPFFRLVYFLPSVIPPLIAALVWKLIYEPGGGYLNTLLGTIGVAPQRWLGTPQLVKVSMTIILTWSGFGSTLLIYLASLQELPTELYEAAELDGASVGQRLWHITIPHLRSTMGILLILQIISVVQIFTEPFALTSGGPGSQTVTPVLAIYRKAFMNGDFGLAAAWSVMLTLVLALFSIVYLRATNRGDSR